MLNRTIRWRSLQVPGLEHCRIQQQADAIHVRSMLIGEHEGTPLCLHYAIVLAPDWTFRSLEMERDDGAILSLMRDDQGLWTCNGIDRPDLSGCIDIDISGTPFTNSLPIHRTALDLNTPAHFTMAFVPLDNLAPFPDGQIYTALGNNRYRFEAADQSFTAKIDCDADGLVTSYPPLFDRL